MDRFDKLLSRIRAAVIAGQRRAQKKQDAPEHHTHHARATKRHRHGAASHSTHARAHNERKHAARRSQTPQKGSSR